MAKAAKRPAKKKAAKRSTKTAARSKAKTAKRRPTSKTAARKPARGKAKVARKAIRRSAPKKSRAERAHDELVANARRALELKNAAPKPFRPENRTTNRGMPPLPNQTIAPEGALEAEGGYPAMERSHKAR